MFLGLIWQMGLVCVCLGVGQAAVSALWGCPDGLWYGLGCNADLCPLGILNWDPFLSVIGMLLAVLVA